MPLLLPALANQLAVQLVVVLCPLEAFLAVAPDNFARSRCGDEVVLKQIREEGSGEPGAAMLLD